MVILLLCSLFACLGFETGVLAMHAFCYLIHLSGQSFWFRRSYPDRPPDAMKFALSKWYPEVAVSRPPKLCCLKCVVNPRPCPPARGQRP